MSQTAYNLDLTIGLPGQYFDPETGEGVVSYVAAEAITPGSLVELDSTGRMIQMPQGTGGAAMGKLVGVAARVQAKENTSIYAAGDLVPVVRKGRVFANWSGTTEVPLAQLNVQHSSTIATNRGFVTDAATSATAGSEISATSGGLVCFKAIATSGLALVEVNFPA